MSHNTLRRGLVVFAIIVIIAVPAIAKIANPTIGTQDHPMIVKITSADNAPEELKRFDLATLGLASATVVLTGVAVILAIAAIWGYKEIMERLIKAAENKAETVAIDKAEAVATRTVSEYMKSLDGISAQEARELVDNLGDVRET